MELLLSAALFAGGAGAGLITQERVPTVDVPLCTGGASAVLGVRAGPEAGAYGETIEARYTLSAAGDRTVRGRWEARLTDENGAQVGRADPPAEVSVPAGRELYGVALVTPRGLADGFYQITLSASGTDGDDSSEGADYVFLEAYRGRVTVITEADWFARSLGGREEEETR